MSETPEEQPESNVEEVTVIDKIEITRGFDSEGHSAVWVSNTCGSIVDALGLIEFAKIYVLEEFDQARRAQEE